jgi:hypothetical protein
MDIRSVKQEIRPGYGPFVGSLADLLAALACTIIQKGVKH